VTGPYEPPKFDGGGNAIPHEERNWPKTPPAEREVRWAYYVTRDREQTLRNAHTTRHDAIGTAARFNSHFDDDPFHVVAHQSTGPMYWDTGEETVCNWCGFTTTIRPISGWSFVVGDDGGSFCTSECQARWAMAEEREQESFPDEVVPI
jgi:hypothetical protein